MNNTLYLQVVHLVALVVVAALLVWSYVTNQGSATSTGLWIPFGALVGVAFPSPFGGPDATAPVPPSLP